MDITIREARAEDSGAIATILHALGWSQHIQNEAFDQTQSEIAEYLAGHLSGQMHTVLVAEQQDVRGSRRVIGYISVHWYPHLMRGETDGYVSELFVHPDARGNGAGSQLLKAIESLARARGCSRLLLMNRRIRESYARQFYAKRGWEEQGDTAFFSLALTPVHS